MRPPNHRSPRPTYSPWACMALALALATCGCEQPASGIDPTPSSTLSNIMNSEQSSTPPANDATARTLKATFGGGCFWCVEAVFEHLPGVVSAVSGYAGGDVKDPTYEQVCSGGTGHAEVVQVEFDPKVVTYEKLLETFFAAHDPTTPNRQGADVGTQYRSIIFTHDEQQQTSAAKLIASLNTTDAFGAPVVTKVEPIGDFYPAEPYHQDYFANNPDKGYCRVMIAPKLKKLGLK